MYRHCPILLYCFIYQLRIFEPKGINASFASLNSCSPNGIPIMVMQRRQPIKNCPIAMGIPVTIIQITFAIKEIPPPPYSTSLPKGQSAKPANLKHCRPIGIPIIVMNAQTAIKKPDQVHFPNLQISSKVYFPNIPFWCILHILT